MAPFTCGLNMWAADKQLCDPLLTYAILQQLGDKHLHKIRVHFAFKAQSI